MRGALSSELKVGLFSILVMVVLSFMTFKIGGLSLNDETGYRLYAWFENTAGVDKNTKVKLAGVDAGRVERIELVEDRAKITLRMFPNVSVRSDSGIAVQAHGLLGDKYLAIYGGTPGARFLADGDTIQISRVPTDYDTLITNLAAMSANFAALGDSLNHSIGTEESREAIAQTIQNIRHITDNLNSVITANDNRIAQLMEKVNTLVDKAVSLTDSANGMVTENRQQVSTAFANLSSVSDTFRQKAPQLLDDLSASAAELKKLMAELHGPAVNTAKELEGVAMRAKTTLDSVSRMTERIDKGEGTLGKLVNDEKLYNSVSGAADGIGRQIAKIDRFKTYVEFKGDYMTKASDGKGAFNVRLQPRDDKYYLIGIVRDPVGNTDTKETVTDVGGVVTRTTEKTTETQIEFTAMLARRFADTDVRIGLIESSFGLGADYHASGGNLVFSADAWDFGKDEADSKNPHIKVGLEYRFFQNLFIDAGYDNVFNRKTGGAYIGGGVRFEDEDLKYLMGSLPRIPGQ